VFHCAFLGPCTFGKIELLLPDSCPRQKRHSIHHAMFVVFENVVTHLLVTPVGRLGTHFPLGAGKQVRRWFSRSHSATRCRVAQPGATWHLRPGRRGERGARGGERSSFALDGGPPVEGRQLGPQWGPP